MEFQKISSFLDKFKNLAVSRDEIKKEVVEVILKTTNITIPQDHITIDRENIFIESTPAVKATIFTKKEIILSELKKNLGKKAPLSIR